MDTLVLDGKTYVKASVAARAAGYTSDYVGQLCRSGAVDAHLVGRSWYVHQEQLGEHRVTKKRMSRVKAREQVRKAIEEKKHEMTDSGYTPVGIRKIKHFEKRSIKYEKDDAALLPEVKKIQVELDESKTKKQHTTKKTAAVRHRTPREPNFEIENKGKKVVMSGTIEITDATDEAFAGKDTVVLTPKILRGKAAKRDKEKTEKRNEIQEEEKEYQQQKTDFLSKLAALEEETGVDVEIGEDGVESEAVPEIEDTETENPLAQLNTAEPPHETVPVAISAPVSGFSKILSYVVVAIAIVLVITAFLLQSTWTYSGGGSKVAPPTFQTGYTFTTGLIKQYIYSK